MSRHFRFADAVRLAVAVAGFTVVGLLPASGMASGTAVPTPVPPVDWPELPDVSEDPPLAWSEHFRVHADPPDDAMLVEFALRWGPELEAILRADERRYQQELEETVEVVFQRSYEARCPARGLAAPDNEPPLTIVYVDEDTTDRFVRGVLAHEFGHHLSMTQDFIGDGVLTEGLANWIGQDAVLDWLGLDAWDTVVRQAMASGTYSSLIDPDALSPLPGEDCIERRDRVYALRTSFVDWMVEKWGLDLLKAMPSVQTPCPDGEGNARTCREPDYKSATGHDLAELEHMWLEEVLVSQAVDTLFVRAPSSGREASSG